VSTESAPEGVTSGDGYAVAASLDALGEGFGFRKVRRDLGVTAFGVNAIVIPPNYETPPHLHDEQEELYILLSGAIEIEFGDGTSHRLEPGGMARVNPEVSRLVRNTADAEAVYVCVGGKDGYVGRDGRLP
jgi:uncharacterized cupin superfamily protein